MHQNCDPLNPFSFAEFLHTGDIESINNLQLKYANKTFSYGSVYSENYDRYIIYKCVSWLGMIVRAALCALDWNWNVGRPQKVDELGEPLWRVKVNISIRILLCWEDFILNFLPG